MEEEKKKKKNKKKKGKQNKGTENVEISVGETYSVDQNHVIEQNHCIQVSGVGDFQTAGVLETYENLDRCHSDGSKDAIQGEVEKQLWLQREASLEEKIRHLQNEKDSCSQREASLDKKIVHLQIEKDSWMQKEASLEERVKQLLSEKAFWNLKGASLEDRIKHLESDKDSWVLKEVFKGVSDCFDYCNPFVVTLMIQLVVKYYAQLSKRARQIALTLMIQLVVKYYAQLSKRARQNSAKEMIARLNEDNIGLQTLVEELEKSRNSLLEENQLLMENISVLQSQYQLLERKTTFSVSSKTEMTKHISEGQDLNTQMEAACALVEKLITENAELVEKVNELYIELDGQRSVTGGFDPAVTVAETANVGDFMYEVNEISELGERMDYVASVQMKDERTGVDNVDAESSAVAPIHLEKSVGSYEADESGEIEQIPLDENEVQDMELQAAVTVERASVPLSDAPLVGAPFRFISFVAKYVSGADLVDKSTLNLGQ